MNQHCRYKNCTATQELQIHHIVPRSFFPKEYEKGKKYDMILINEELQSNRVLLCKKHHDILEKKLLYQLWKQIPEHKKEDTKKEIYTFTKKQIQDRVR